MQRISTQTIAIVALVFAGTLSNPALADKPASVDKEKASKHTQNQGEQQAQEQERKSARERNVGTQFNERQRAIIRDYYAGQFRAGRCPPGLAKKNTGCMPPGQAKKWSIGQPLPRDVVYYDLPPRITVRLGVPPAGHRYVRVASDILLIAIGTGMVVDAIEDLARR